MPQGRDIKCRHGERHKMLVASIRIESGRLEEDFGFIAQVSQEREGRKMKALTALIERLLSPGYGHCFHCRRPWRFVLPHSTNYHRGSACFPLCEKCWGELTIDERIPYYEQLLREWAGCCDAEEIRQLRECILNAVFRGM